MKSWSGIWTAIVTPFLKGGEIDWTTFDRLLDLQIAGGVTGIVPFGTTGESPTLLQAEKDALLKRTLERCRGTGILVFAGTGTNSTRSTIENTLRAQELGADGFLVVTPYYNKPTQRGLLDHYTAIAQQINKPILLYNVPGRTGCSLQADTVVQLAQNALISGIKEASGGLALTSEIFEKLAPELRDRFSVLSGDDGLTIPIASVGGRGVVSVMSNVFPHAMVALWKAWASGDPQRAAKLHEAQFPLFRDLFVESNPAPIKAILSHRGLGDGSVRGPLAPLSATATTTLMHSGERVVSALQKLNVDCP